MAKGWLTAIGLTLAMAAPIAQTVPSARVSILLAEERGARDAHDLATLRAGVRNADGETARTAIRALGRLGRPALIPDLVVALKSPLPELRSEAADAIASALAGASPSAGVRPAPGGKTSTAAASAATAAAAAAVSSALSTLLTRLNAEEESSVRAAICEALGRFPLTDLTQMARVESALVGRAHSDVVGDRLGAVKGLESFLRANAGRFAPHVTTTAMLRELVGVAGAIDDQNGGGEALAQLPSSSPVMPPRDARIRRLAFQSLVTAGEVDGTVIARGAIDPDAQVRWLAMRAAGTARLLTADVTASVLHRGMADPQSVVRMEALRSEGLRGKGTPGACQSFIEAVRDPNTQVALVAIDLLGDCGVYPEAVDLLNHMVNERPDAGLPRGWHRAAHALVGLSRSAPDRAKDVLGPFTISTLWGLRAYAARAAAVLQDHETLETLSADANDDVARIAQEGLGRTVPSRQSAAALAGDPSRGTGQGLNAADLQRLAAPRARVTIRGVGTFELALFTSEAPAAVLRFARLAEAGHYNGMMVGGATSTILNLIPHAGDGPGDERRVEAGSWPHVRGALGLSSGDQELGGAQVFVDLVDNPRFDHQYPVFAQLLNGVDILDQILEGDVIERVEILTGP